MGYSINFSGQFVCEPQLKEAHHKYLETFCQTERMRRDPAIVATLPDPVREAAGLPIGDEACYFVGGGSGYTCGDASVIDASEPPAGQPGCSCQWIPTPDGNAIEWDGNENFDEHLAWLDYLIKHFLGPWGYKLNGEVEWHGENYDDFGLIIVEDNAISIREGECTLGEGKPLVLRPTNVVTERALLRRINRKLAKDQEVVRRCRENSRGFHDLGTYYRVDLTTNLVVDTHIDIETLGRELDVLGESESV
jgi:hypothetical protein